MGETGCGYGGSGFSVFKPSIATSSTGLSTGGGNETHTCEGEGSVRMQARVLGRQGMKCEWGSLVQTPALVQQA